MPDVTITLPDEVYRSLCRVAAARGVAVGKLIAERLEADERKTAEVMAILDQAQEHYRERYPDESEDALMEIAVEEVRAYRAEKAARERAAADRNR
jgi:hypothetical protein